MDQILQITKVPGELLLSTSAMQSATRTDSFSDVELVLLALALVLHYSSPSLALLLP